MIARALLASLALATFALACTQNTPPVAAPAPTEAPAPAVAPAESPSSSPTPAPTTVPTAAPAASGRPCLQNVMCIKGTHFDRTACRCVCDDGNAACADAGAK